MRRNVLQTWTPAWLLFTALPILGPATTATYRAGIDHAPAVISAAAGVEYCAAFDPLIARPRPGIGGAARPRKAAAMLLVLMAQRGRLGLR